MGKLIKNGTIVTATDAYAADILIQDGSIDAIGRELDIAADVTIDASGKYVFPGAIDVHTHLSMPFGGTVTADDFETGTIAAACGGTTTIIDFALQGESMSLAETLAAWKEKAEGKAVIDYGFHLAITDSTDQVMEEIPAMVEAGAPSFKCFMAYKDTLMIDDHALFRILLKAKECDALVLVHAENGDVIDVTINRLLAEGKTGPKYHAVSRPPEVEAEATARAIRLAEVAGVPLYIVHISAAEALEAVQTARARGLPVYGETCTHYLVLTEREYDRPGFEGAKFVCSPPLRDERHQRALWDALENGSLQVVSSDHCPFNYKGQKELGRDNFALIPNGMVGIEDRLYLMYTQGVAEGRIGLNRFVELVATAPAKFFGLFPRKGTIAVGSDADLVIFDPEKAVTLSADTQHQNVDYSAFEGFKSKGAPVMVLSKGKVIVKDGEFVGDIGAGEFLHRRPFSAKRRIRLEV